MPVISATLPPLRVALSERLDGISNLDDDAFYEMMNRLEEAQKAAIGFRYAAQSTQKRQDSHLARYLQFIRWAERNEELSDEEAKSLGFPNDFPKLYRLLRLFVFFIFENSTARYRAAGDRTIQYNTLVQFRQSMHAFWVPRIYRERNMAKPPSQEVFLTMTESMRAVQARFSKNNKPMTTKSYVGLGELRLLIEKEMETNRSIEVSEQHQMAWCLARTTAVRPGSIGAGRNEGKGLTWRDLQITAGDGPGQFDVVVTFKKANIKAPIDPEASVMVNLDYPLRSYIKSPTAGNLPLSVPHRLLVIALRRGLLVDISTLDELFSFSRQNLLIKPDHLDEPILLRSLPKGIGLDPASTPLRADRLTDYLSRRGKALGFSESITFYSIRRRAATDLVRRVGLDAAKIQMGHMPDSHTLVNSYLDSAPTTDLTAVATEEPIGPGGHSSTMVAAWAPLALTSLSPEHLQNTRGVAVATLARQLEADDPNRPDMTNASSSDVRKYRRRAIRHAQLALHERQQEIQRAEMTRQEHQSRLKALDTSKLVDEILARAQAALLGNENPPPVEGEDSALEMITELEQAELPEADLEEATEEQRLAGPIAAVVEQEDLDGPTDIAVPYEIAAKEFMRLILENTLSKYSTWAEKADRRCPKCVADPTATLRAKNKQWASQAHLDDHLSSSIHSGVPSVYSTRRNARQMRADLANFGFHVSQEHELIESQPHPERAGILLGDFDDDTIPKALEGLIEYGLEDEVRLETLRKRFADDIEEIDVENLRAIDHSAVPKRFKSGIIVEE